MDIFRPVGCDINDQVGRSAKMGVYWHENGLLMERGEGQMGNVGFTYMPYSDLGFAKTWIEIPTRYPPTTPAVVHQPTG